MYIPKVTKRMIQKRNQNTDDSFSNCAYGYTHIDSKKCNEQTGKCVTEYICVPITMVKDQYYKEYHQKHMDVIFAFSVSSVFVSILVLIYLAFYYAIKKAKKEWRRL